MFRINTNVMAINARRQLGRTDREVGISVERLASGLRINRAADDAAGLFVSEQMRAQIRGLKMANQNVQNAISLIQTAEGAMEQLSAMLIRLKELAVQSADGTYNDTNRQAISVEVQQILEEIDRIAESATFNGMTLLQGRIFTFQVGDSGDSSSRFSVQIDTVNVSLLLPGATAADWGSQNSAILVIASVEEAINSLNALRTKLGAAQNRLENTLRTLQIMIENTTNAESVIRDADFAEETAALTRALILVQSGTSVLSQANSIPQNALTLLQFF